MKKILMFCHHPDVLHYMWMAFTELGHEVYIATEKLTLAIGFKYSSVKSNKFEVVNQLFDPIQLFPDMKHVTWADSIQDLEKMDILWSMLPEILSLHKYKQVWFDAQMQGFLRNKALSNMPGIKTANHPDAFKINNFHFMPNWVAPYQQDITKDQRIFITQLITQCDLVRETETLKALKNKNFPVKIYGGDKCPDGFIRDIEILPYTSLLIHNKDFGINCYAVCKALDMGIPVYMSRATKELIGFGDLPDNLFIFSEDFSIEDAYEISCLVDNSTIQNTYRTIYTLNRTKTEVQKLIK